jgi:hypothetical protein
VAVIVIRTFPSIALGVVVSNPDGKRDGRKQWLSRFRKRNELFLFFLLLSVLLDLDLCLGVAIHIS